MAIPEVRIRASKNDFDAWFQATAPKGGNSFGHVNGNDVVFLYKENCVNPSELSERKRVEVKGKKVPMKDLVWQDGILAGKPVWFAFLNGKTIHTVEETTYTPRTQEPRKSASSYRRPFASNKG